MNVGVLEFRDLISRLKGVGGEAGAVRNIANRCSDAEGPACGSRAGDAPIDGLNPPLVDGAVVERPPGWDGETRPGEPGALPGPISCDTFRIRDRQDVPACVHDGGPGQRRSPISAEQQLRAIVEDAAIIGSDQLGSCWWEDAVDVVDVLENEVGAPIDAGFRGPKHMR